VSEVVQVASAELDLQHARSVAVSVAQEAGELLRSRIRGPLNIRSKGNSGDVVTSLDLEAEALIVGRLRREFPDHRIVAEESGAHDRDSDWTWLVDPLDGTNNVAIGLPVYVVGIALCFRRRPVVGVIYESNTGETWSAVRDGGTCTPCGPVAARRRHTPHGPVLGWTQGHAVDRSDSAAWALKLTLEQHAQRLLQLWAPLLCWVMLARGDIDGFVGYRPGAIDLPAGSLIAAEAGFSVVTLSGDPFDESVSDAGQRSFVAGHPGRIPELLRLVRAAEATQAGLRPLLGNRPALVL
jgi:myo-inositol-1(or 4)-monophosphatase